MSSNTNNQQPVRGFKGFDKNLKCRGQQYKVGETTEHKGPVVPCESGLHFCEHPLDVFGYYAPNDSRFAEVTGSGEVIKNNNDGDTKVCCSNLHIEGEIGLSAMINAAVKFVFDRAKWTKRSSATGDSGAASATGYSGAASATGKHGIAASYGIDGRAKGAIGVWLVLSEWKRDANYCWQRVSVKTALVDGKKIKADTFYILKKGKIVKANN